MVSEEKVGGNIRASSPEEECYHRGYDAFRASLRPKTPEEISARKKAREYWHHPKTKLDILTLIALLAYTSITFVLMVINIKQLNASREQVAQAKLQTRIAKGQAALAESDHRPFVFVTVEDKGAIQQWSMGGLPDTNPGISSETIIITNYGHTPAIIDSAKCDVVLDANGSFTAERLTHLFSEIAKPGTVIADTDKPIVGSCLIDRFPFGLRSPSPMENRMKIFTDEHSEKNGWMDSGSEGIGGMWVLVYVAYHDAFGKPHTTSVCALAKGGFGTFSFPQTTLCNQRN